MPDAQVDGAPQQGTAPASAAGRRAARWKAAAVRSWRHGRARRRLARVTDALFPLGTPDSYGRRTEPTISVPTVLTGVFDETVAAWQGLRKATSSTSS